MNSICDRNQILRNRYFDGMLLATQDLQAEQDYHRQKLKIHNRCLHGCRVACGLEVKLRRNSVYIDPGMALDCCGNQIVVCEPVKIDLPSRKRNFYLTISYKEEKWGRIPIAPSDRYSEGYEASRVLETFKLGWTARNPMTGHKRHNGAWVTCGKTHPVPIAKFKVKHGKARLSITFEKKISDGRHNW